MSSQHRIVWSQGMFLQPQHFQQEARFFEYLIDARLGAASPYAWGFVDLVLDEAQLSTGHIALMRAQGVLPDGAPFSMPDGESLPAPLALGTEVHDELIVLAAPRARPGTTEVDLGDGPTDGQGRYGVIDKDLRDQTRSTDDPEPVQLGALRLRLLRQRDALEGYAALGVVRVIERRADGQVVLERNYIAPQTRIDASGQLSSTAGILHGLVRQRAKALAEGMSQLSNEVSEAADIYMLQLMNRTEPLLHQCAAAPKVHPWHFYTTCLQLAGEMATFARADRLPPEYPAYQHDALQQVFAPVLQDLREYLSAVIQRHAVAIALTDRGHGVSTAAVTDGELLRSAGFVLTVRSQMPAEQLRQRFPLQTKVAPADRIKELVNLQLPGIVLRSLAVAPRQLPYHTGSHYFEFERQGELWKQFERSGILALHVSGNFPALELELWAVRQG